MSVGRRDWYGPPSRAWRSNPRLVRRLIHDQRWPSNIAICRSKKRNNRRKQPCNSKTKITTIPKPNGRVFRKRAISGGYLPIVTSMPVHGQTFSRRSAIRPPSPLFYSTSLVDHECQQLTRRHPLAFAMAFPLAFRGDKSSTTDNRARRIYITQSAS